MESQQLLNFEGEKSKMITTNDIKITQPVTVPGGRMHVARIDLDESHSYRAYAYTSLSFVFLNDTNGRTELHSDIEITTEYLALQLLQSFVFAGEAMCENHRKAVTSEIDKEIIEACKEYDAKFKAVYLDKVEENL